MDSWIAQEWARRSILPVDSTAHRASCCWGHQRSPAAVLVCGADRGPCVQVIKALLSSLISHCCYIKTCLTPCSVLEIWRPLCVDTLCHRAHTPQCWVLSNKVGAVNWDFACNQFINCFSENEWIVLCSSGVIKQMSICQVPDYRLKIIFVSSDYKHILMAVAGYGAFSTICCICFCCIKHRSKSYRLHCLGGGGGVLPIFCNRPL